MCVHPTYTMVPGIRWTYAIFPCITLLYAQLTYATDLVSASREPPIS